MDNTRPTPLIEDIDGTRRKLESWISAHRGHAVSIAELSIPEATGMSNVTLLFDLTWQEDGQQHSEPVVARLQPSIERPVFPDYDLGLQYEVMDAIGRNSDIPVPELRGLEQDKSLLGVQFYLMKRTEGRIPTDMPPYNMDGWMMHETSVQQRQGLWQAAIDTMARYHQLDYQKLGFARLHEPGMTPLQQQLAYWQHYLDWALEGAGHTYLPAGRWTGCRPTSQRMSPPCCAGVTLAWATSSSSHSLDGIAAVLDWEMAVLGNPVQDLAWFNYLDATFAEGLGMPRLEGLPTYEQTITRWEQASGFLRT